MEDVLDAVDHDRAFGVVGEPDEALDPQELRSVGGAQEVEEHVEGAARHRLVARQREGADAGVVPVDVVMMAGVMPMMLLMHVGGVVRTPLRRLDGLGLEPAAHVGDPAGRVEKPGADEAPGRNRAMLRDENLGAGI